MLVFEYGSLQNDFLLRVFKFEKVFHEPRESFFNSEENQYFETLVNDKRKNEFSQARFELKKLLSQQIGLPANEIEFKKVGEGKPVLLHPKGFLDFNISHSHEYFAIALSRKGHVGVDIEQIRAPHQLVQIAERFFSKPEADLISHELNKARQTEIFAKFWSGKEALVKAVGGGVFKNVHDVLIDEVHWKIKRLPSDFGSLSDWQLQFFDAVEGYTCSVAFKTNLLGE